MKLFFLILSVVLAVGCHKVPLYSPTKGVAEKMGATFYFVYFGFDRWQLNEDQNSLLDERASLLKAQRNLMITLEGHTDEIGSEEYNLMLGDKRAREIKYQLVVRGVEADRIAVVSYGGTRPKDPRHNQQAYTLNRRVELKVK